MGVQVDKPVQIQIKRIYELPAIDDGYRVLVDRLWPRGVAKERASIDLWLKDAAPSPELRTWFHRSPESNFDVFRTAYLQELSSNPSHQAAVSLLMEHAQSEPVTLLFAARELVQNHAAVLRDFLMEQAGAHL